MLASIYAATIAVFLQDDSEGYADTRAFLGRRIEDIMKLREDQGRLPRPRLASPQPVALHRPAALPGGVSCPHIPH